MSDNYEPAVVSLEEPRDRAYWARRFQMPVEEIDAAVRAVGNDPALVAAQLDKPWPYLASGIV